MENEFIMSKWIHKSFPWKKLEKRAREKVYTIPPLIASTACISHWRCDPYSIWSHSTHTHTHSRWCIFLWICRTHFKIDRIIQKSSVLIQFHFISLYVQRLNHLGLLSFCGSETKKKLWRKNRTDNRRCPFVPFFWSERSIQPKKM